MHAHRQQSFWQIKFPMIVGVILLLLSALCVVLASVTGRGDISTWADISLIWLITPMLLLGLIAFAATAAMIYMLMQLLPILPRYSRLVLNYINKFGIQVGKVADASVEPFLRVRSLSASIRAFKRSLRG